jgi:hypothetical protein
VAKKKKRKGRAKTKGELLDKLESLEAKASPQLVKTPAPAVDIPKSVEPVVEPLPEIIPEAAVETVGLPPAPVIEAPETSQDTLSTPVGTNQQDLPLPTPVNNDSSIIPPSEGNTSLPPPPDLTIPDEIPEIEPIPEDIVPATPIEPEIPGNFLETEVPTGEFFKDLQIFIKQLGRALTKRYERWEGSTNGIMKILRTMQQTMEYNTNIMLQTIKGLFVIIEKGFRNFELKRDEIERFSDADYKNVAKHFKKTIELLNFQIREFRLQNTINELYEIFL